jgi:hypothetical protein
MLGEAVLVHAWLEDDLVTWHRSIQRWLGRLARLDEVINGVCEWRDRQDQHGF